jgi:hypothetical protein
MIVYRIEKNGLGPYRSRLENKNSDKLVNKLWSHLGSSHPTCVVEIPSFNSEKHICGFSCVTKLKKWFHGSRAELRRNGYLMALYEVDPQEVLHGNLQVVFPKFSQKLKTTRIP